PPRSTPLPLHDALPILGCSEIVMSKDAVLGNFDYLKEQPDEALKARRDMLVRLAADQGYPPLLFQAMLDRDLVLYRVHAKADPRSEEHTSELQSPDHIV